MTNNRFSTTIIGVLLMSIVSACAGAAPTTAPTNAAPAATAVSAVVGTTTSAVTTAAGTSTPVATPAASAADAASANKGDHDDAKDHTVSSADAVAITLTGTSATVNGAGVTVSGSQITITTAGIYSLSGSLTDGQLIVNTTKDDTVKLIFNGVTIHNSANAAIDIIEADQVIVFLAEGTASHISDGASYVFPTADQDEPNAAFFSKADLTIDGPGSLTVDGNYNDGLASKDGLVITDGNITVTAADDGIRGKDYIVVKGGQLTVTAGGDGLKSDDEEDSTRGYISIEGGQLTITAGGDGLQAETDILITSGDFHITTGGGSNARLSSDLSAKGIKAGVNLNIDNGTFTIDSADDALHSNGSLIINDGTFVISTGDDAMHADATLQVNGGQIAITQSYEGIESQVITLNGGDIHLISRDDGINVSSGKDASGTNLPQGQWGQGRPQGRGGPGQDAFAVSADAWLYINGGYIVVNSGGDGIDVNGSIAMTGGTVIVHGPTEQMNGALDCNGTFNVSGGFLVGVGSSGMAEAPDATSAQNSLLLNLNGTLRAGNLFHIETAAGDAILTFAPDKNIQSIVLSSAELARGVTYNVYYGGTATGTAQDGLYHGGAYTPGTAYTTFTVSSALTALGSRTGFR